MKIINQGKCPYYLKQQDGLEKVDVILPPDGETEVEITDDTYAEYQGMIDRAVKGGSLILVGAPASELELLKQKCDELDIGYSTRSTVKSLTAKIEAHKPGE